MDFGAKSVLLMMAFLNQVHKAFKMVFVKDILKCFFFQLQNKYFWMWKTWPTEYKIAKSSRLMANKGKETSIEHH